MSTTVLALFAYLFGLGGTGSVGVRGDTAVVLLGVRMEPEVHAGEMPSMDEVPLPPPSFEATREDFLLRAAGHLSHRRASELATDRLRGEKLSVAGRTIEIRNVAIAAAGDSLKVSVEVRGAAKGTLNLYGIPTYAPRDSSVHFEALEYDIKSRNLLVKAGSFLAHGLIRRRLERALRCSVGPQSRAARTELTRWLNRTPGPGFRLRGSVDRVRPESLRVKPDELVVAVRATGSGSATAVSP